MSIPMSRKEVKMSREDIRLKASQEKVQIYEQIHNLFRQGKVVRLEEHKSGFPAITVDCEDIHILTDILSLEQWWAMIKSERR